MEKKKSKRATPNTQGHFLGIFLLYPLDRAVQRWTTQCLVLIPMAVKPSIDLQPKGTLGTQKEETG